MKAPVFEWALEPWRSYLLVMSRVRMLFKCNMSNESVQMTHPLLGAQLHIGRPVGPSRRRLRDTASAMAQEEAGRQEPFQPTEGGLSPTDLGTPGPRPSGPMSERARLLRLAGSFMTLLGGASEAEARGGPTEG